ncbi:MAG TPA: YetF domain-containing protein [Nocardioidaceae bacterium]|nr:YetF domain-containing protein [Nocardioidaceae bacterium]
MWHDIFTLGEPALDKVIRAVLIYAFLVLALRVAGKRELAQLNTLDFVVLLAVANAVQNGLIGNDSSVTGAVLGAAVLFVVNGSLAFVLFRQARLRRLVEGTATVLVRGGVIDIHSMRREGMTDDDLLVVAQEAGVESLDEIDSARLEPSGKVVVVPRRPDASQQRYDDLVRRLDELTALVRGPAAGA